MSGPLPKEAPVLPPLPESVNETFKILENNPVVKDALKQIKEEEQLTMADQIALTEIEAPPFHEEVRAAYFAERLRELGLTNVRIDKEGNVIGIRPGKRNGPPSVSCGLPPVGAVSDDAGRFCPKNLSDLADA